MTRQWIRSCRLLVGDDKEAMDLSELRIQFTVSQGDIQTPNFADIIVTNLSAETVHKVQKEFTKVRLEAGYEDGGPELLFAGTIKQKRSGRENPVDTYLGILAVDGDKAYNFATVNKTLAAGHSFRDHVNATLDAMKPFGITAGYIADLGGFKAPRGRVLFGMARDILRRVGYSTDTSWSIQNGKLQIVKNKETVPGGPVVLNSRTGMIGLPVQTFDGIVVRCLLNPKVKPGTQIKIDQSSIQQQRIDPAMTSEVANTMIPSLADDGLYKALIVNHTGDTRGGPWYTDITCIRADGKGQLPPSITARGISVNPDGTVSVATP